MSTKGLTKNLRNKFIILNRAKYFSSGMFQNYLVFIPAKNTLNILVVLLGLTINLYISYTLSPELRSLNAEFTSGNCLFGSVKLTKNTDPDKYLYTGYGIGFNLGSDFSLRDGSMGKNVIIFDTDMSSSVRIDNKKIKISHYWWRTNARNRWYHINIKSYISY